MGRHKKPPGEGSSRWEDRKVIYTSVTVRRDLAEMLALVARYQGLSVANLIDPLLREPIRFAYAQALAAMQAEIDARGQSTHPGDDGNAGPAPSTAPVPHPVPHPAPVPGSDTVPGTPATPIPAPAAEDPESPPEEPKKKPKKK